MRLGRILGPESSFLYFLYLCAMVTCQTRGEVSWKNEAQPSCIFNQLRGVWK